MLNRKPLRPNKQELQARPYEPVLGPQWPKGIEEQSIKTWAGPGRGPNGESVTGGPNTKRTNIRKGPMR
jgi:hypothetical protein